MYKHIIKSSRQSAKRRIILLITIGSIAQIIWVSSPYLVNQLLGVIETQGDINDFYFWSWFLLGFTFVMVIFERAQWLLGDYLRSYLYSKKIITNSRKFIQLDHDTIKEIGTGKAITRIEKGTRAEIDIITSLINLSINTVLRGSMIISILLYLEPLLAGGMIFVFIIAIAIDKYFYTYLAPLTKKNTLFYEQATRDTTRLIMEHNLISLSNMQSKEVDTHEAHRKQLPGMEAKISFFQYTGMDIIFFAIKLVERSIYFWLGWRVFIGEGSFAYMVMIVGYIRILWSPIQDALYQLARINRQKDSYKKLSTFLSTPVKVIDGEYPFVYKQGTIVVDNISFGYTSKKNIFTDFSLRIAGGKTTALVGHSGSGKSTLLKLLLRNYDVQQGTIYYDDQVITSLIQGSLYDHIGYVSQEPSIFDGSVYENLCYGISRKVSDQEIKKALSDAQCQFLYDLPKGLETQLGEKGVKLSGGERQRLTIARLMLRNPAIIILDEPTSALDSISEDAITQALRILTHNKTVIVIAHRLQTVQHADTIIVLEQGKIIEQGTHESLLQQEGTYASLVNLQHGRIEE